MIELLPLSVVFGTSLWVLFDSRHIGIKKTATKGFFNMGPTGWFFSCLLCWIAAFPAYLVKRREYTLAMATPAQPDRTSGTDIPSQFGALADLSRSGLLTAEEYQTRKHALVFQILERAPTGDVISQLGILADLSAQDLLTEDEFQAIKKELVHRMLAQSSQDATT